MKKQIDFQLLATLIGGILFNYLFWMEEHGVNLLLFSIFIIGMLMLDKEMAKSKKMLLVSASHLLAGLLVVFNQSELTIIAWYISVFVFIGVVHAQQLRSIFTAFLVAILQIVTAPFNLFKKVINTRFGKLSIKPLLKPIKYIIMPLFVLLVFSGLYSAASPVFAKYLGQGVNAVLDLLEKVFYFFFSDVSFARLIHTIFGILLTAAFIISFANKDVEKAELTLQEKLTRKRKNNKKVSFISELSQLFLGNLLKRKMALKTEYIIGIISFAALNLLLLALNIIDFTTLWIGNVSSFDDTYLSTQLHEGANSLIFSIIMAMLVILYFFSGNLNFFSKNKTLKILAYAWIIQNTFLVFSVLIRDYHYINLSGLTYKRIGVLVFLTLCLIGLFTVYIKVAQQKTLFFLVKVNGQIWYILLLIFGMVNWDVFIVNYNINNRAKIALDLDHLMDMSDKTLPIIDKNKALLSTYVLKSNYAHIVETEVVIDTVSPATVKINDSLAATKPKPIDKAQEILEKEKKALAYFNDDIDNRIERFKERWEGPTWLSWNYRDWQTYQYFTNKK